MAAGMVQQRTGGHGHARLPYLTGLDGLRALAVGAVLLYHAGLRWLPGGFLGVEVFFVISGYLITCLLLAEWRQAGRIDLPGFWLRRARRLLPALFLVLLATLTFFVIRHPDEVAKVRADALAAIAYVTNWYFILREQSYFEVTGRPSALQHLWSLAIEEQFYLVWPLLLPVLIGRWGERRTARIALAGAAASTLLMAALYRPGADPSRVYYGTDTRATGLLLGAALAMIPLPWRDKERRSPFPATILDAVGFGALAVLIGFFVFIDERQAALYRGGFAALGLTTAVAIVVAVSPWARAFPRSLEWAPIRWIGVRSYGIYLWHWPVFVVTRPELDVPLTGPALLAVRLGATLLLAGLSYRFVEAPIRAGALGRISRTAWVAVNRASLARACAASACVGASLAALVLLGAAVASARPPAPPEELAIGSIEVTVAAEPTPEPPVVPAAAEPVATPTADPCAPVVLNGITAIGDSVMIGAAEEMEARLGAGLYINATIGRLPEQIPALLRERRQLGQLGDIVIIHTGDNGYVIEEEFDLIMAELSDVPAVIWINVRVPRQWEEPSNEEIAAGVKRYPNTVLIDWYGASAGHPEYLKEDGIHPSLEGRAVFASLIAKEVDAARAYWATQVRCGTPAAERPVGPGAGAPGRRLGT
jgi:peptidoglycan/LPS O-acetylase OafA/YrhL